MARNSKRDRSARNREGDKSGGELRAVGYVRCSTEEQQARAEYNTLDSQRDYISGYIRTVHPEWELAEWYEDPGYSGKDTNRPGLQSLLRDLERGKFDVVVVYKLDRITRSLADFFDLDRVFIDHEVSFISVKEQFDTSSPMGRAMRNIALTFAELEREMVAERVKDKMLATVRRGRWPGGTVPFGYDLGDGKLIPDPVEAPAVKLMFETYVQTKSLAVVRDKMNAMGIPPKGPKCRKPRDGFLARTWNKQKVAYIVRNRTYLGVIHYDGIEVPETHEPLVDKDLFDRAQAIVAEGYRKPRLSADHDYFLTGKVLCGDCRCKLTPKSTNHPNRKKPFTPYYECYRLSKYRGYPCKVRRVNAEVLERLFLQTIERLVWDRDLVAAAASQVGTDDTGGKELRAQEAATQERLAEIDGKVGRIIAAVEDGLAGSSVQARLRELESQQVLLKGELADIRMRRRQIEQDPVDVEEAMTLFARFSELFEHATAEEKEALADALLKSATVDENKVVEFELYVGSDPSYVAQNVRFGSPEGIRTLDLTRHEREVELAPAA